MKLNLRLAVPLWFYLAMYYNLVDATGDSIEQLPEMLEYDKLLEQLPKTLEYDNLYLSMKEKNKKKKKEFSESILKMKEKNKVECENLITEFNYLNQIENKSTIEVLRQQEIISIIKLDELKKQITLERERIENTKSEITKTKEVEKKFKDINAEKGQLDVRRTQEFLESRLNYLEDKLQIYNKELKNTINKKEEKEKQIKEIKKDSSTPCAWKCLGYV